MKSSKPQAKNLNSGPEAGHLVQFYRDGKFLAASLAEYVRLGFSNNEGVVTIATEETWSLLKVELNRIYPDFSKYILNQQILFFDAEVTLSQMTTDGKPNFKKFKNLIDGIFNRMQWNFKRVRFYEEVVNLFCAKDGLDDAMEIEKFWNMVLNGKDEVLLMCGYATQNLKNDYDSVDFLTVTGSHSDTIPAERFVDSETDEGFFRRVAALELRSAMMDMQSKQVKKLEEELAEIKKVLCQSGKLSLLGELSTGISHEFNDALSYISLHNQVMKEDVEKLPMAQKQVYSLSLQEIEKAVQRMKSVVVGLLSFSQKDSPVGRDVCVVEALQAAIGFVTKLSAKEEIDLALRVSDEDHTCYGVSDQLVQVFVNAITQAKRSIYGAQKSGGGRLEITVARNKLSEIEITFHDNGNGVPFHQDVALTVSEAIVAEHLGRMHVQHDEGAGTCLKVILPRYCDSITQSNVC
jgi:signal transduction histidine kinase